MKQFQFDPQDRRQKLAEKKLLDKKIQRQKFRDVVQIEDEDGDFQDHPDYQEFTGLSKKHR